MKRPLWILNSALLVIFVVVLVFSILLKQDSPSVRVRRAIVDEIDQKKVPTVVNLEAIYKDRDIFDTFIPEAKSASKEVFTPPMPEFISPKTSAPPPDFKQEFVEHLKIRVNGIISSSREEDSVVMISDETNKEQIYHLGDRVKDGQIIRIANNSIVVLRANGQQEIFLLREEDSESEDSDLNWKYIVNKVDNFSYNVDPIKIALKVKTLGQFLEGVPLNTAYRRGKPIGLRVGPCEKDDVGALLGLQEKDLILSVNGISVLNGKDRNKIYNSVINTKVGDSVTVLVNRNDKEKTFTYKLLLIRKPKKEDDSQPSVKNMPKTVSGEFKQSSDQKREARIRKFQQAHKTESENRIDSEIRRRIFENMRRRAQNRRVR